MKYLLVLMGLLVFISNDLAAQQQSAKMVRKSNLHEQPKPTSAVKSTLSAESNIQITKRHRAWYNIKSSTSMEGWVKMLNVRFIDGVKREGQIGVEGVFENMVTRQLLPTASTGVRGFDEAALKKATANKEEVKKLHNLKVDREQVNHFASEVSLVTNNSVEISKANK
jgi:hypothetical protein